MEVNVSRLRRLREIMSMKAARRAARTCAAIKRSSRSPAFYKEGPTGWADWLVVVNMSESAALHGENGNRGTDTATPNGMS